jgi:vanillate O-demethylase monooxygenase subunit
MSVTPLLAEAPRIGQASSNEARNYPYDCWWVAAFASELGQNLIGRWLLDTPVLLYRTQSGEAVALRDRCPHRAAPLSAGQRLGDDVQCGYHGFTFAPDGRCVRIPSMDSVPRSVRVEAFPVIEQGPFVWVYLGDRERLDSVPPPPVLDWWGDPGFATVHGAMPIAGNYMLLKENVLDLTHFGYVHRSSFKITDWKDPPVFETTGDVTGYRQSFSRSPLPPIFAEPMGLPSGAPYDRENYGSFQSPALQIAAVDLIDPDTRTVTGRFRVVHATTPVDMNNMHYLWLLGRDFGIDPERMEALKAITEVGFAEDEAIIEAVQRVMTHDRRAGDMPEVSVKMDTAGVQARRIVQRWMDKETS